MRVKHKAKMQRAIKLIDQGVEIKIIANKLGYAEPKILRNALRAFGYRHISGKASLTEQQIKQSIKRHQKGETIAAIAGRLKVAPTWLSQLMRSKYGYFASKRAYAKPVDLDFGRFDGDGYKKAQWDGILYTKQPMRLCM